MFTLSSIITEQLRDTALAAEMETYLPPQTWPGWIMNWSLKQGVRPGASHITASCARAAKRHLSICVNKRGWPDWESPSAFCQ